MKNIEKIIKKLLLWRKHDVNLDLSQITLNFRQFDCDYLIYLAEIIPIQLSNSILLVWLIS